MDRAISPFRVNCVVTKNRVHQGSGSCNPLKKQKNGVRAEPIPRTCFPVRAHMSAPSHGCTSLAGTRCELPLAATCLQRRERSTTDKEASPPHLFSLLFSLSSFVCLLSWLLINRSVEFFDQELSCSLCCTSCRWPPHALSHASGQSRPHSTQTSPSSP